MITPEKLFTVIKDNVVSLGAGDLMGLVLKRPETFADLSPALQAAFEKAAAELTQP